MGPRRLTGIQDMSLFTSPARTAWRRVYHRTPRRTARLTGGESPGE
jgi:hypothetical protein